MGCFSVFFMRMRTCLTLVSLFEFECHQAHRVEEVLRQCRLSLHRRLMTTSTLDNGKPPLAMEKVSCPYSNSMTLSHILKPPHSIPPLGISKPWPVSHPEQQLLPGWGVLQSQPLCGSETLEEQVDFSDDSSFFFSLSFFLFTAEAVLFVYVEITTSPSSHSSSPK